MLTSRPLFGFIFLLLLAGCTESPTEPRKLDALPRALTVAEQEVIAASNVFAFDLFGEIVAENPSEDVFISPLSASLALGMTMNGARGETFGAMSETLGFAGLTQAEINRSYQGLIDLLVGLDPQVEMQIANSIWYRESFPFHETFFDTTRTYFNAEVAGLDFTDPASVDVVNSWVDESTNGKIESILERIKPDDVMFLINAIYFKGDWQTQFDPADTRTAPFTTSDGGEIIVEMMHRHGDVRLAHGEKFQAADLLYGSGAFSMTVILPDRGVSVDSLAASLDAAEWSGIVAGFTDAEMDVYLPKFRLEFESSFKDALRAMGMEVAFTDLADFSGMSPGGEGLLISDVFQKAFVEVNEKGTEAAAVTKVTLTESAPPSFLVDRPFIFAIRERFSGTILFIGKMEKPQAAS